MNTLIIYDTTGRIIYQVSGSVLEPVGIPFMWVEIPLGKYVTAIDVTKKEHEPIFTEYPKSDVYLLQEQVDALNIAIAQMMGV